MLHVLVLLLRWSIVPLLEMVQWTIGPPSAAWQISQRGHVTFTYIQSPIEQVLSRSIVLTHIPLRRLSFFRRSGLSHPLRLFRCSGLSHPLRRLSFFRRSGLSQAPPASTFGKRSPARRSIETLPTYAGRCLCRTVRLVVRRSPAALRGGVRRGR
jgi:hypothetical protein